ncbi:MAG: hypothetical protein FI704_08700 [SAR202 cluster bacterium]|nr:hypothetical protein [SAR202 cluster bacterium]
MSYITDLALRRGSVTVLAFIIILGAGIFTFLTLLITPIIYEFMHETIPNLLRLKRYRLKQLNVNLQG